MPSLPHPLRAAAKTILLAGILALRSTTGAAQEDSFLQADPLLLPADPATGFAAKRAPLLYVLSSESQNGGLDLTQSLFFIFRDGTSIYSSISFNRSDPFPRLGSSERLRASPAVRQALAAAMDRAEIGLLGDCRYVAESPELELELVIRGFASGRRENTFRVTTRDDVPDCSPAAQSLVDQIAAFRRRSIVVERVSTP
jgi:hypothetical protein